MIVDARYPVAPWEVREQADSQQGTTGHKRAECGESQNRGIGQPVADRHEARAPARGHRKHPPGSRSPGHRQDGDRLRHADPRDPEPRWEAPGSADSHWPLTTLATLATLATRGRRGRDPVDSLPVATRHLSTDHLYTADHPYTARV